MHNLLRYYFNNRMKIWLIVLAIVFLLIIIQFLNSVIKQNNTKEKEETTFNDVVSYNNENKTIMSEDTVPTKYSNDFNDLIKQFYTNCINHEYEKSYELLSDDMKKMYYKTELLFENLYCKEKFDGDKQFSFQSWSQNGDKYVYQIKIFENMLSTGKSNNDDYIEDYVTIVPEGGLYKLNVDSYIGNKKIYKTNSNDLLEITVNVSDMYINNEIYTINVKNITDKEILLDTRKDNESIYIVDEQENKFNALIYENKSNDLMLKPKEAKTIKIKFNDSYRDNLKINEMNFEDIVNYDEYLANPDIERDSLKIEF